MLKMIFDKFKSIDSRIKQIMKYGFLFSFTICIISIIILLLHTYIHIPELYYIGLSVFQLSLFFTVDFIVCGIAIDTIRQQIY